MPTSELPTITINVPQLQPSTPKMTPRATPIPKTPTPPSTSHGTTPKRVSSPTSATAPLTSWTSTAPSSCYLCDEQNPGDFSPTTKFLTVCELCSRLFCPIHKDATSPTDLNVCNINHSRYYHDCLEAARKQVAQSHKHTQNHGPGSIPVLDEGEAEDMLVRDRIFPSIGEKERMLWQTSPVSDARMREIANFRSLDAEMRGTKGQRRSTLIETKEMVGADIAV